MSLQTKTKSNTTRALYSRCGGYMGGRLLFLPGEISYPTPGKRDAETTHRSNLHSDVKLRHEKSAEAIVPWQHGKG